MKTVFENKQLAHIWAHTSQSEGRNSNDSFYFSGDTIYSYGSHFPIAKHVTNERGEVAVLFTERTYSNTTQRHVNLVRNACYQDIIYCYNPESTHAQNFAYWVTECEEIAANLKRARKPEKYLNEMSYIGDKANKYASFFGIDVPDTLQQLINIENAAEFDAYRASKAELLAAEEKKKAGKLKKDHKKALNKWLAGKTDVLYLRNGIDYLRMTGENVETSQ